jgi:hypothetical protein
VIDLHFRVELFREPGARDPSARALSITASNRGDDPVSLWACIILTLFGARLYLEPHLDYPLAVDPGEWCTEWVSCTTLARALRDRGCAGRMELIPVFLEVAGSGAAYISWRLARGSGIDASGIEHRGEPFVFDVDRWPSPAEAEGAGRE